MIIIDSSGSLWQFKRVEIERDVNLPVNTQHIPNNLEIIRNAIN